jgi:xylan 1,4-beta-xylosidase
MGKKGGQSLVWVFVAIFGLAYAQPAKTYTNPVLVERFTSPIMGTMGIGDPAVIFHEGKYYLYPTGDNRGYDVYISSDLVHWKKGPRVFRTAEFCAWAPDVLYNPPDRKFYLYYTVNGKIGVAASDRPDGTFEDRGVLIENAIDAQMFLDEDGRYYLYYAELPAFRICVQPMESPLRKKGKPIKLLRPDSEWEKKGRAINEAPWMLKHGGIYYLLYSGGGADTRYYAIGYASSKSPTGPFVKYSGNPIMKQWDGVYGPGHCAVTKDADGKLWIVYHQKTYRSKGWDRVICIDPLWFDAEGVLHGKPTRAKPQVAPATAPEAVGQLFTSHLSLDKLFSHAFK